jgi:hypothetical protein
MPSCHGPESFTVSAENLSRVQSLPGSRTLRFKRAWRLRVFTALAELSHGEKTNDNQSFRRVFLAGIGRFRPVLLRFRSRPVFTSGDKGQNASHSKLDSACDTVAILQFSNH